MCLVGKDHAGFIIDALVIVLALVFNSNHVALL